MSTQPTAVMPTDVVYGKVVGRFILAVADANDPDRLPDAVAASGQVVFTPAIPNMKTTTPMPTTVVKTPIRATINDDGFIIDQQGELGVWLVAGRYKVTYSLVGAQILGHDIEVTIDNDDTHPLDLTNAIPPSGSALSPSQYEELTKRIDALPYPVTEVNGKTGIVILNAGDVGAYTKDETDAEFVTQQQLTDAKFDAIDYPVDSVNGKLGYVILNAGDVGAYTQAETDAKFATQKQLTDAQFEQVSLDIANIDYPVDSVNGKLGAVTLTAGDVGAYTKAEADAKFALEVEMAWRTVVNAAVDTRPDALHVIWVGGSEKPANMTTNDLWVQDTA